MVSSYGTICGMDANSVLAYETPKLVRIKDQKLGITKYALSCAIFMYVVVYTIFYCGEHLTRTPVEGNYRLQWQEPTRNCNPMATDCKSNYVPISKLPYCKHYSGANASGVQSDCHYFDAKELPVTVPQGVLIPTFIKKYKQKAHCKPEEEKDWGCVNKYIFVDENNRPQTIKGEAKPIWEGFVADVDHFTVLIDHTVVDGVRNVDDGPMTGYFEDCSAASAGSDFVADTSKCERKRIHCMDGLHCSPAKTFGNASILAQVGKQFFPKKHQVVRPNDEIEYLNRDAAILQEAAAQAKPALQVKALPLGDVLSLESLLTMAGVKLDQAQGQGEAVRSRGTAVSLEIKYNNWTPWTLTGMATPEYTIRVRPRKVRKFKNFNVEPTQNDERRLVGSYGVLILMSQTGQLCSFSVARLLIVLTTSLGLLAVANTGTDYLALYFMRHADQFQDLKYQVGQVVESEDKVD